MSLISRLFDFVGGTRIKSDDVDAEFNQLVSSHNAHDVRLDGHDAQFVADEEDIATAITDSAAAVITADSADTKSDSAVTTANEAKTLATNASSAATSAVSTSNLAMSTATTAQSVAEGAVTSANSAQSAAEAAAGDAADSAAAVALKVDKTYVDQVAADFILGTIPDGSMGAEKLSFDPATQAELDTVAGDLDAAEINVSDLWLSTNLIYTYGNPNALILDLPVAPMAYIPDKLYHMKAYDNNGGLATTIRIGSLTPVNLYREGAFGTPPNLVIGKLYLVWYDQVKNCFFLKASGEGNAVAADLLAGKTATADNGGIVGTIPVAPNYPVENTALAFDAWSSPPNPTPGGNHNIFLQIPKGYYDGTWVGFLEPNLKAENLKKDVRVGGNMGIIGTLAPGKKFATGQTTLGPWLVPETLMLTVTGLTFEPKTIIIMDNAKSDMTTVAAYNPNMSPTPGMQIRYAKYNTTSQMWDLVIDSNGFEIKVSHQEAMGMMTHYTWFAFE